MGKIKEFYHEEITRGQQEAEIFQAMEGIIASVDRQGAEIIITLLTGYRFRFIGVSDIQREYPDGCGGWHPTYVDAIAVRDRWIEEHPPATDKLVQRILDEEAMEKRRADGQFGVGA